MNTHDTRLPVSLQEKLEFRHGKYTAILTIYHVFRLDQHC